MSQQPMEYATPEKREPRRFSHDAKWALIVFALIAVAVVAFIVLLIRYIISIGPLDSH